MASITTRAGKGSALTNAEVDANFTNLNTELGTKVDQAGARSSFSASGSLSYNSTTGVFSYTQPTNVSTFTNDSGYLTSATAASTYLALSGGTLTGDLNINSTGAVKVSAGTTAQRPGTPVNGMLRYNSTTAQFEGYANSAWGAIAGSGSGLGQILETAATITSNYSVAAGNNAFSVGPVTIASGVSVSIPAGRSYLIAQSNPTPGGNLVTDTGTQTLSNKTFSDNPTFSGGTANGVAYLNGSKVLTTGSALSFDGTNFATTGTASATKLIPTGGTATGNGMFLPAANTLGFSTNGTQAMTLDASSRLMLGTTTASSISGTVSTLSIGGTNANTSGGIAYQVNGTVKGYHYIDSDNMTHQSISGGHLFLANNTERFRIGSAGQIGLSGANYGTSGQVLTSNGSGSAPTWQTASGGSPGGSNTQVQYNSSGSFAGSANFTFDGTNIAVASRTFGRGAATSGGANNVAAGQNALSSNTTGEFSIAMGYNALTAQTTGASNTGLGNAALAAVVSGSNNTGVGRNAFASTTASDNTGVGYFAGLNTTSGASNTAVGSYALYSNTTASFITAVGREALYANTTGASNSALGYYALGSNTTGSDSTAVGREALSNNTTADANTAVGYRALTSNTTGNSNVSVGTRALYTNSTGSRQAALGYQALYNSTTSSDNTAVGSLALLTNTTGAYNTAVGSDALRVNTTASWNTAVGYQAGYANTTGLITAVGSQALNSNTTGAYNVAVGGYTVGSNYAALTFNTTGSNNTAVGIGALQANTTANNNTAVGYLAAYSNTTGASNTAIGLTALYSCTSGNNNVCVGSSAGYEITTGTYNVYIGQNAGRAATTVDNEIVIGSAGGSNITGKGTSTGYITPGGGGVYQGNNSSSWSTTSDFRLKKNIVDNNEGLEKIAAIRVRNFEYRLPEEVTDLPEHTAIKKEGVQLGVIAQELQQVCPDCVKEESTGVLSVDSDNVFWHMVNAIKQLKAEVDSLKAQINQGA